MVLPSALQAFRYRNYRLFFAGQSVAITGGWMTLAALGWLLFRLTGDPFMLGLMGFFLHAPTFLIAPLGGVLVDRVSRRAVIVCAQAVDCVTVSLLAGLTLGGLVEVWQVLALCGLMGITKGFEMPARLALVVDIVDDRAHLASAVALNSTIFHGARLVGPMLAGGLLIPLAGEGACFLAHAVSYLIAMRCFSALRPRPVQPNPAKVAVLRELKEGIRYALAHPPIRALMVLTLAFVLLGQSFGTLLPIFAKDILKGDSGTYGLLLAASGFGAVAAAIRLASRKSVLGLGRVRRAVPGGLHGQLLGQRRLQPARRGTLLFGAVLALFALSRSLPVSLLLLVAAGLVSINVMVGTNIIIQTLVDDRLRGRVMSLHGMLFMGALPLGALLHGKVAGLFGATVAVLVGATGCVLAGIAFRIQLPSLRRYAHPLYVERGILPAQPGAGGEPGGGTF